MLRIIEVILASASLIISIIWFRKSRKGNRYEPMLAMLGALGTLVTAAVLIVALEKTKTGENPAPPKQEPQPPININSETIENSPISGNVENQINNYVFYPSPADNVKKTGETQSFGGGRVVESQEMVNDASLVKPLTIEIVHPRATKVEVSKAEMVKGGPRKFSIRFPSEGVYDVLFYKPGFEEPVKKQISITKEMKKIHFDGNDELLLEE